MPTCVVYLQYRITSCKRIIILLISLHCLIHTISPTSRGALLSHILRHKDYKRARSLTWEVESRQLDFVRVRVDLCVVLEAEIAYPI